VASANAKNPLDCCSLPQGYWVRWFAYWLRRRIMAQNGSWNMKIIATKFILAATPILELHILSFLPIFEIYIFIKHFLIVLIVPI
jgi:hypothetical protein